MSISAAGKGGTMSQVKCSGCGNLRMISGAKDMHALENSTDPETGLSWEELKPTLEKNGWGMPSCPGDSQHTPETSYEIGQLGIDPTCKINQRHRLTGVGR
jgi:hypothetical protein